MHTPAPPPRTPAHTVRRLQWKDEPLGTIRLPAAEMTLVAGFGSGLARRSGDPPGLIWAVGDRGPNVKPRVMVERYGVAELAGLKQDGAKVMPMPAAGPAIACLQVRDDRVEPLREIRLVDESGELISGLPPESSDHAKSEPAFALDGMALPPDPSGLDTEGIVAFANGEFLLGDEFGPSLVRVDAEGRVLARHLPQGCADEDATYPVSATLPGIAAKRQLNRGFEALALSPDESALFLAFQSPLALPDEAAHKAARHVRLWHLDARSLQPVAQYAYPLDPPATFRRDAEQGEVDWSDLKVSEVVALAEDRLLVLERCSATTKLYSVTLRPDLALASEHWRTDHRPSLEELSGQGERVPALAKTLLFSTDDVPEVASDMEGMVVLSPTELLLVNDNDFGVEGAATQFWRVRFTEPVLT